MATRRRNRFIYAQTAWVLATVLALLGSLTYELFFVMSLIGFLAIVELTAPSGSETDAEAVAAVSDAVVRSFRFRPTL